MMRVEQLLWHGAEELQKAGVPEYELDARLLLEFCTSKTRTELFLDGKNEVLPDQNELFLKLLARRKKREPVAYIIGEQEFWSLPFFVTPDVLIPRPETEFLLEQVLAKTSPDNITKGNILDLCCGSGVIATVLALETGQKIFASDFSFSAIRVSCKNFRRHNVVSQVALLQGDLLDAIRREKRFSLIVSNPPYVSDRDVKKNLEPEVSLYEPHLALNGGEKGMELILEIRNSLPHVLSGGGQFFMEIGAEQGEMVNALFHKTVAGTPDFTTVEVLQDYAGRDRVLHARLEK